VVVGVVSREMFVVVINDEVRISFRLSAARSRYCTPAVQYFTPKEGGC